MLVVLAIITILTAIILTSQSSFNRTLILDNTAYDIGLTVRSTETYGISSQSVGGINNIGYGLDFESSNQNAFVLFGDTYPSLGQGNQSFCHSMPNGSSAPNAIPGDCRYEATHDTTISSFTVANGIKIDSLSVQSSTNEWVPVSTLDIVFARPNAEPFISAQQSSNFQWICSANNDYTAGCSNGTAQKACILLTSPSGGTRAVKINMVGEITADTLTCS